jgi:4-hydroxy-3-polyprenylbenzoate decarboxylase
MKRLIVGISGASGAIYGVRMLEVLRAMEDVETHLVMSRFARMNIEIETSHGVQYVEDLAVVIAPCSMKTLSGIVHSAADSLLVRAADVVLKEQRRLVLMPREAPLHVGHCKLLYEAAQLGAVIAPPMPAFYNRPKTIDDLVNHSIGRVLDLFDLDAGILKRWEGPDARSAMPLKS